MYGNAGSSYDGLEINEGGTGGTEDAGYMDVPFSQGESENPVYDDDGDDDY